MNEELHMFSVYQFSMSEAAADCVNTLGWAESKKFHPEVAIHQDILFTGGSEKFESWMGRYYKMVGLYDVADLNAVFAAGNDPDQERALGMRSISIGDIILDDDGVAWMVDFDGFNVVNVFGLPPVMEVA
jgi:hypothetical protein